jgi:3-carboxy-cis,cis-muconate cycloisomerase
VTAFGALFVPDGLRAAVSGHAWLGAMLECERALARAGSLAGLVPQAAAEAVAAACDAAAFDGETLAAEGRAAGNPVEPLVRALRARVSGEAEQYVHLGATSQDVMDTAAMLVSGRALDLVLADLDEVARACAALGRTHRSTPMAGRTLLQHAVPTTFGLTAAGWLTGVLDARASLRRIRSDGLAAQLGGAAGTLAALGMDGPQLLQLFAAEVGLPAPDLPWHTNRVRVAELGGALAVTVGAASRVALDIVLLAQTEVAEVAEGQGGGSSTMPHKRNPARAVLCRACARLAAGHASVLLGSLEHEHERAAGAWQAEWEALSGALAYSGGAAAALAASLDGLVVDTARMDANLRAGGGLVVAERVAVLLAGRLGRQTAHDVVGQAAQRAAEGEAFRDALLADERLALSEDELEAALDPATYLGSAETLVDRALERYAREEAA